MHTTSVGLLERLRQPHDEMAWGRFVQLYTPLLLYWGGRLGLQEQDAADLAQEVFAKLVQKLPEFRYDPSKSFRSWLRTVLHNTWHNLCARRSQPQPSAREFPEREGSDPVAALVEAEYAEYLVARALTLMRAEFQPATWKACWEQVVEGRSPAEVAAELDLSVNAVYIAKRRVLARLRRDLAGLLD